VLRWSFGTVGVGLHETCRTPWLVAGRNKPAALCTEKAVEVVRNHADGTGSGDWYRWTDRGFGFWEWTCIGYIGGGASTQLGEVMSDGRVYSAAKDIGRQGSACRVVKTTKVDILCI